MDLAPALSVRHTLDRAWIGRFRDQCAFARAIAPHHAEAKGWEPLLARAEAAVEAAVKAGGDLPAAVRAAEGMLAPIAPAAKGYTLRCVGHAHIDMNWMWGWPETVAVTCDTFRTVLALMDEFPAFTFAQSQVSTYELVRHHEPELFARIRARIAENRWEVTASHWVEGERNTAGGEALCRHLLLARRWCREHLGLSPEQVPIDWVPDCFGHANTIPAADARGAVRGVFMWRSGRPDRPAAFRWRSPDGSEVIVIRELGTTASGGYNGNPCHAATDRLVQMKCELGLQDALLAVGIGDHGGGPTRRHLLQIAERDSWPVYPRWQWARVGDHLALLAAAGSRLPLIQGELNTEYTGCYTAQTAIKIANRRCENALAEADGAAAVARAVRGRPVERERLRAAWQDALFNHFHDILPGSGVRATRERACGQAQGVLAEAGAANTAALRAVGHGIDTAFIGPPVAASDHAELAADNAGAGSGAAAAAGIAWQSHPAHGFPVGVVMHNPCAWDRREVLQLRAWEGNRPWGAGEAAFRLRGPDGSLVPAQRLGSGNFWGHNYVDLVVPASVGAVGWQAWALEEGAAPPPANPAQAHEDVIGGRNHPPALPQTAGRIALENEHICAEFDRGTGGLRSLRLKDHGLELCAPGQALGTLLCELERAYPMSAWITNDVQRSEPAECEAIEVAERGPWRAAVRVRVRMRDSRFTLLWTLGAGEARLGLAVFGRWLERGGPDIGTPRLVLRLPTALEGAVGRYETPNGWVDREQALPGSEQPALRFVHLRGRGAGLVVANDGKNGYVLRAGELRVLLIRSSYEPDPLPEIGDHSFAFSLTPHHGELPAAAAVRAGAELNHPLRPMFCTSHPGPLPAVSGPLIACDREDVLVTQLKWAEDAERLVLRLQNCGESACAVRLRPLACLGPVATAEAADLLERPLPQGVRMAGGLIEADLPPRGLATVLLGFAP